MPKDKPTKKRERIHLGKIALAGAAVASLASIPNDYSGGNTPAQDIEYALEAADADNWYDPDNGVLVNVQGAIEGTAANALSMDGVLIIGGSAAIWWAAKRTGIVRSAGAIKTKNHKIGV